MQENIYRFELNLSRLAKQKMLEKTINLIPYTSCRNSFDRKYNFVHHRHQIYHLSLLSILKISLL